LSFIASLTYAPGAPDSVFVRPSPVGVGEPAWAGGRRSRGLSLLREEEGGWR